MKRISVDLEEVAKILKIDVNKLKEVIFLSHVETGDKQLLP